MADHQDTAGAAASNPSQANPSTIVTVHDSAVDQHPLKLSKDQLHSQSEGAVPHDVLKNISELAAAKREKYRRTGSLQEKAAHQRDQTTEPLPYQTVLSRNKVLGNVLTDVNEVFTSFVWPNQETTADESEEIPKAHDQDANDRV
ncbi:hypothetical protein KFL_015530030 [Klebsormidium nitens]|uniref:Uncharacterized protein n=1 Tax=Klebsormidium nitens TaxID=105231 RepID=A0A1Y1IYQ6_KLENI|nr:hypothetical protein KFL_015530030 [Klebsormidium nitens]|eukprot:GAQ93468.1 hypothetical protein KFL_015530030 [Klebsormidium nitens]